VSVADAIDELLIRWQELRRHGAVPPVSELCADHPSLTDELQRRIAAFESMEAMLGLGSPATLPTRGTRLAVPAHLAEKFLPLGYEILEVIDQGGMGVVYKATQIGLQRTVALKMLAGFRVGPKQLARFRVEAEAIARLHHAHIVQIYEVGEVDGHSFFAMEFVAGGTLAHRLANGPLPPTTAAELVEVLARAIHHAHTRGIVHRDLKPANILLASREENDTHAPLVPKVTDFGLAKRLGTENDHTTTGEVIGTPAYMAPEQAQGWTDVIGPPCDVYALGAILYECLTGCPPFKGNTILETLRQAIADDPVAPRRLRSDVPRDLEAICLKCLEKKQARRYASAEALADDLRCFLTNRPVVARRASVAYRTLKWTRRHPIWASALALVVLATGTVVARDYIELEQRRRREAEVIAQRRARAVEVAPQVREILNRNCADCHGAKAAEGTYKFNVLDYTALLDPNRTYIVPEHADLSRLILRIEDGSMPPKANEEDYPRVSDKERAILKDWIEGGAPEFPPENPKNPTPPVVPYSALAAEVKAIFIQNCYECHQYKDERAGINIMNHPLLLKTRPVVVSGQPEASELFALVSATDKSRRMPKGGPPLADEEIDTIRRWIEAGAPSFPRTRSKDK
jgi:mono/diheme cytochrome c family protein